MKAQINRIIDKVLNTILTIQIVGITLFVLWVGIRIFLFETYSIPSDSMRPTLIPGDKILVNKAHHGARLYRSFDFIDNLDNPNVIRTHGFRPIRNNDIVVFNFPYGRGWDSIYMEHPKFFCKRVIAIPGDTLTIKDGIYRVNEKEGYGNMEEQMSMKHTFRHTEYADTIAYPLHHEIKWTLLNFGPMLIPKIGNTIKLGRKEFLIYRRMITFETSSEVLWNDSLNCCTIDGVLTDNYTFTNNWYFMGGDASHNSQDSRYFGPIPDDFIAGRASHIYWSKDKYSGSIRYDRFMVRL